MKKLLIIAVAGMLTFACGNSSNNGDTERDNTSGSLNSEDNADDNATIQSADSAAVQSDTASNSVQQNGMQRDNASETETVTDPGAQ